MLKRLATIAICAGCLIVAACNTIDGAKQDAKSVGDTFSNMADSRH
ncbi:entericidin A/B family lipoprotein [Sphingomonas sp. ASY06-1R]|jgi:predicted small secreted protein